MKKNIILTSIFISVSLLLTFCGKGNGVEGEPNQWMVGKTISVKVIFENIGVSIRLRNDTQKDFSLKDLNITYIGDKNGKSEIKNFANLWLASGDSLTLPPFGIGDEYEVGVSVVQDGKTVDSFTVEL